MMRFVAQLNDSSYVNIPADKMKMEEAAILVFREGELVAYLDTSCVLVAKFSERNE